MSDTNIQQQSTALPEEFGEVKRAVVVCAHADDMETMMGGTAALLAAGGVEIFELICTLGDLGSHDEAYTRESLAEVRMKEARYGAQLLGVRDVEILDYHDGELEPTLELRAQIAEYYRKWQPDTLFTFDPSWAGQIHPDHRAVGRAAIDAVMPSKMRLYRPAQLDESRVADVKRSFLFGPANPTLFVDVTAIYETKLASCRAHLSQFPEGDKNLDWMRELDKAAAKRAGAEGKYMEQFDALRIW